MAEHKIELMLNGQRRSFSVETEETLLHVLREKAGLTGTKKGCDLGEALVVPAVMLRYDRACFLDDVTPQQLSQQLGVRVEISEMSAQGLVESLTGQPLSGI